MDHFVEPESWDAGAFRERVRSWLAAHGEPRATGRYPRVPAIAVEYADGVRDAMAYERALWAAGLAGVCLPSEYGGGGLPVDAQRVFDDEMSAYEDPRTHLMISLGMCIPTLLTHGTDEQRRRWIPPILRGEQNWCQLFSEPSAGSDLASLRTSSERADGGWIVNGAKVWNSGAHCSTHGLLLARAPGETDERGRSSLTLFGLDMATPGVDAIPLRNMTGVFGFCSVQLSDVFVRDADVIGAVGGGWQAANTTLGSERTAIGAGASNRSPVSWQTLAAMAHTTGSGVDDVGRQELAGFFVEERMVSLLGQRMQEASEGARPHPSLAKLARAELAWQAVAAATTVAAPLVTARARNDDPAAAAWPALVVGAPAQSIGGGTSEVMKNIVAERVLGLPREPQPRKREANE